LPRGVMVAQEILDLFV